MTTSPHLLSFIESEMREAVTQQFRIALDRQASDGVVCLCFNRIIASLVAGSQLLSEPRKETIRGLCRMVSERPFPTLLWARLTEKYLDSPSVIVAGLDDILNEKMHLSDRICNVVKRGARDLGFRRDATILVVGFSTTIIDAIKGLPPEIKGTLKIFTPFAVRWGQSQGYLLKAELERDPLLKNKTVVLNDVEATVGLMKQGRIDLMLMGAKAIGVEKRGLRVINSYIEEDFPAMANELRIKTVLVSGKYKIWPADLFQEQYKVVSDSQDRGEKADLITAGECIHMFLTDHGVFGPDAFCDQYQKFLNADLNSYPNWSAQTTKAKAGNINIHRGDNPAGGVSGMQNDEALYAEARKYFEKLMEDDKWYLQNSGKHVAICGGNVIVKSDLTELVAEVNDRYQGRPVFISPVTRAKLVAHLSPGGVC